MEPGGSIEIQDNEYPLASHDSTIQDTNILKWSEAMVEAAKKLGRSITVAPSFKSMLADAGFTDIVEIKEQIPMNGWPLDSRYKQLGEWSRYMLSQGIEGISMGLLTEVLGLPREEVHVLLASVRKDLSDKRIHGYWRTYGSLSIDMMCVPRLTDSQVFGVCKETGELGRVKTAEVIGSPVSTFGIIGNTLSSRDAWGMEGSAKLWFFQYSNYIESIYI